MINFATIEPEAWGSWDYRAGGMGWSGNIDPEACVCVCVCVCLCVFTLGRGHSVGYSLVSQRLLSVTKRVVSLG